MDKLPLKNTRENSGNSGAPTSNYDKLLHKIDGYMKEMSEFSKQNQSVVKSVVKMKIKDTAEKHMIGVDFKSSISNIIGNSIDGVFKGMINPKSGGMLDQIFEQRREKRRERLEENRDRKEFKKHYFENTQVGRAIKDRPDADKQADKLFDQILATKKSLEKQHQLIEKKSLMAEKFGIGGPLVKDIKLAEEIKNQLEELLVKSSLGKNSVKAKEEKIDKIREKSEKSHLDEEEREQINIQSESLQLLAKIEENTRKYEEGETGPVPDTNLNSLSLIPAGLVSGLAGIASNVLKSLLAIFNPKVLFKLFSKVLVPVAIVASVVNGIMDGFEEFTKTGSIKKALIAGVGGILDFLTFGLFDKDTVQSVVDTLSSAFDSTVEFVSVNIVEPIMNAFHNIKDTIAEYAKPIWDKIVSIGSFINDNLIQPIVSFYSEIMDNIRGVLESIKIPSFSVGPWDFGPWEPFKPEAKVEKTEPKFETPVNNTGDLLKKNSDELEELKKNKNSAPSQTTVVNSGTTVNNKTTLTTRRPVRNQDASFNRYIVKA